MGTLNLATLRQHLLADYGISHLWQTQLEEARTGTFIGYHASACFDNALQSLLTNLREDAVNLLQRAESWLRIAIGEHEIPRTHYFPNVHEALLYHKQGLCEWLLTSRVNYGLFGSAADHVSRYLVKERDKTEVAYVLPMLLLAERDAELLDVFRTSKALSKPLERPVVKCPGKMSFLLASNRLTGTPSDRELRQTLEQFLRYKMPICTKANRGLGLWHEVPEWMLIYAQRFLDRGLSGIEATLHVLDFVKTHG